MLLEQRAVQQSHEDAQKIVDVLTPASTDCPMSGNLAQRLAAVRELAERITRNTAPGAIGHPSGATGHVRIPTLHLRGTSGEVLRHQHRTAVEALRRAVDAVCDAVPHARDYHMQGDDAVRSAQRDHAVRIAFLRGVREELEAITSGIETQLEDR